jgi:hypothetical protein
MKSALTLLVLLLSTLGSQAQASGYLGLDLFYWSTDHDDGTTDTKITHNFPTLTGAWVGGNGLVLGATYNMWTKTSSSNGSTTNYLYNDYGPTVGYMTANWHAFGTYLYNAKYSVESGGTTTYEGNGLQFELAYQWASGSLTFGPSLIYATRTYTKQTAPSEATLTKNMKQTDLMPFLNLAYEFK